MATMNIDEVVKLFTEKNGPKKFSGKNIQELQDYEMDLENACYTFGVPMAFIETFLDSDMERTYDIDLNRRLYNLLFATTVDQAKRVVLRHKLTRDGRAAWFDLQRSVNPPITETRLEPYKAAINFTMDAKSDPEKQLNELDRLIEEAQSVRDDSFSVKELFDLYVNALTSVQEDIYKYTIFTLNRASLRGEYLTCNSIKAEAMAAWKQWTSSNPRSSRRRSPSRQQAAPAVHHPARNRTSREPPQFRQRRPPAANPDPRSAPPNRQPRPKVGAAKSEPRRNECTHCKLAGLPADKHWAEECPVLKAFKTSNAQRNNANVSRTKVVRDYPPSEDEDEEYATCCTARTSKAIEVKPITKEDMTVENLDEVLPKALTLQRSNNNKLNVDTSDYIDFLVDSGCDTHTVTDSGMVTNMRPSRTVIELADGRTTRVLGRGDVSLGALDSQGNMHVITLQRAAVIEAGSNLIDVDDLTEHGFLNPDFKQRLWEHEDGTIFPLQQTKPCSWRLYRLPKSYRATIARAKANPTTKRNTDDWQLLRSIYDGLCERFAEGDDVSTEPIFDTDLFTDGKPYGEGNAQRARVCRSLLDPYQEHSLAGRNHYGNPPYNNRFLYELFHKAHDDFLLAPETTSFTFVVPKWENSEWWHFTFAYTIVEEYPPGSRIFTCPVEGTYDTHKLQPAEEEGGPGRVFIAGTPWPVVILHRDSCTPPRITDTVQLHLRLGHAGAKALVHLLDKGVNTGLNVRRDHLLHADPLCLCVPCKLAKARRPGPHRPTGRAAPEDTLVPFTHWTADTCGAIQPTAMNQSRYFVYTGCVDTCWGWVEDIASKTQALDALLTAMTWTKRLNIRADFKGTTLYTDNGTEFVNKQVQDVMTSQGVLMVQSAPYVKPTNGRVEVNIRDLTEKSTSMMFQSSFPEVGWPHSYRHGNWLRNRLPRANLGYASPYEIIFKRQPDLSYVRIFGTEAYSWLDPSQRGGKLYPKAREVRYVGHPEHNYKLYLLLDESTGHVFTAAEPVFVTDLAQLGRRFAIFDGSSPGRPNEISVFPSPRAHPPINFEDLSLLDLSTYYEDQDHETVGILKFANSCYRDGAWVTAREFLEDGARAYEILHAYVSRRVRLNTLHHVFPIFQPVQARPGRAYEPGVVVANDVSKIDLAFDAYTVALQPVEHDPSSQVDLVDVSEARVRFLDPSSSRGGRTDHSISSAAAAVISTEFSSISPELKGSAQDSSSPELKGPAQDFSGISYSNYKEPRSYKHALTFADSECWVKATAAEMKALHDKGVMDGLDLSQLPQNATLLKTKFVFKIKLHADGSLDKYKVRMVAKGYLQVEDRDFNKLAIYAPSSHLDSFRILITLALQLGLHVEHLDVKTAFLNSDLKEDIYISLPEGYTTENGHSVAKLNKGLYGLRQAAHNWFAALTLHITSFDKRFRRSDSDPTIFLIKETHLIVYLLIHIDDIVMASNSKKFLEKLTRSLDAAFGVNHLGQLQHFLQIKVDFQDKMVKLSQARYITELATKYELLNSKAKATPLETTLKLTKEELVDTSLPLRELLGSLLWIARATRPDVAFAVNYVSTFANAYNEKHYQSLIRVLTYLYHTRDRELVFTKAPGNYINIKAFSDSDWASDVVDRRSYTGSAVFVGNSLVSWTAKKQPIVTLSSCEAEYVAAAETVKNILNVRSLIRELTTLSEPIELHMDNTGAAAIAQKDLNNQRTKHIDVRYHFIREWVQSGVIKILKVHTSKNISDLFTKNLPKNTHHEHCKTFLTSSDHLTEEE